MKEIFVKKPLGYEALKGKIIFLNNSLVLKIFSVILYKYESLYYEH